MPPTDSEQPHLVRGIEEADSWGTDAHKWLNVPYDSGLVFVRDRIAHQEAMTLNAAYYAQGQEGQEEALGFDVVSAASTFLITPAVLAVVDEVMRKIKEQREKAQLERAQPPNP